MKLFRTSLAAATVMAFLALSVPSFAQQDKDNDRDRMKSNQTTVTGCLSKADSGEWVITAENGNKLTVIGKQDFDKHANHTEKLMGTPSEDGKSFVVVNFEHVADSCQAK
jgi:hypothetical protein